MDWQEEYKRKLVSAEEAVRVVKSGDRVCFPLPVQPRLLAGALWGRKDELEKVDMYLEAPAAPLPWLVEPGWEEKFPSTFGLFVGAAARAITDERRADFLPLLFTSHFKRWDEGIPGPIDVLMVVLSPPDEHGYCSFGGHLWNKRQYAKRAKKIIAEVSELQIRTGGDNYIHVSEVDCFVEHTPPLMPDEDIPQAVERVAPELRHDYQRVLREVDPSVRTPLADLIPTLPLESVKRILSFLAPEPGDVEKAIAENYSTLVRDGDTIQIGVGAPSRFMPDLGVYDNKVDLGLHTEMGCPGVGKLVEHGVITGKYKTIHNGKAVASTFTGCRWEELQFINNNPIFEQYDAVYAVDIRTFAAHENMVTANNGISVDLTGQINSETAFGGRLINGHGGQPESHIGAFLSKGGRAITLLRSTALGGAVPSIVPKLEAGDVVTIPRYFADYIVTEYGIASLFGKPIRKRAEELISVAHPDHRSELRKEAQKLFYK